MRIKTRNKVEVAFSMSGMTDIVFLLLLFFMITSTMIAPNALKLLLPQLGTPVATVQSVPEVYLNSGGSVSVEGRTVNIEELDGILRRQLYGQTDPTVKLITSPDVTVKETVRVMNLAVKGNYKVVLVKQ